jgi:hypothetical protein
VQELRGQGSAEEGGQGGEMPEMWRDWGTMTIIFKGYRAFNVEFETGKGYYRGRWS